METTLTYEGKELIVKPRVNETFAVLNNINVNNKVKTKMGLNYLSWAYAWGELLKNYPDATFNVYNRTIETAETITTEDKENGVSRTVINKSTQEVPYFTDGRTCFVKVGVTVNGIEYVIDSITHEKTHTDSNLTHLCLLCRDGGSGNIKR